MVLGGKTGQKSILIPLAIISIVHLPYHLPSLVPWLQGNVVLVDFIFNFDDTNNKFETQLDTMLQDFEDGLFKE